jgi:hypothetical protein
MSDIIDTPSAVNPRRKPRSYIRSDDRSVMIEIEPNVAISLKVGRALGIIKDPAPASETPEAA